MKTRSYLFILIAILGLSLMLTACEKKGPVEEAGEQVDQAIEKTKETVEEKLDSDGPAENAGEKVDESVENVQEKIEDSKE